MTEIWKEFKKLPGERAQCLKCPQIISCKGGSTSGLWRHLENKHNLQNQSGSNAVPSKQSKMITAPAPAPSAKQSTLIPFLKRKSLSEVVSRLAATDGFSISAICKSQFIRQSVAERGFTLPKTKSAIMQLIHDFFEQAKKQTIQELTERINTQREFVSLTTDEWTSLANKRYFNVNLHFADGAFYNLGLVRIHGSFPADKIMQAVEQLLISFNVKDNSVAAVTSDGASVMVKFGKMVPYFHQLCYNHGLHLAVQDVLYRSAPKSSSRTEKTTLSESEFSDDDDDDEFNDNDDTDESDDEDNSFTFGNILTHIILIFPINS